MNFPAFMMDQARWMVRHPGRIPISAHESKPFDYKTPEGKTDATATTWRYRWTVPCVWSTYEAAKSLADRDDSYEGLCYILHPCGDDDVVLRLICFDFDGCYDEDGNLDPVVAAIIADLGTFTEFSRTRTGLHVFVLVRTYPFRNLLRVPVGGCKVDVLCNAQVAVTGDAIFDDLKTISYETLEAFDFFEFKEVVNAEEHGDLWDDDVDEITPGKNYLIDVMEQWPTAVSGEHGQQKCYAGACRLQQHGVKGHEAELLLELMPADPPFEHEYIRRTIETAHLDVIADGSINTLSQADIPWGEPGSYQQEDEFQVVEVEPPKTKGYGFDPVSLYDLMRMDLKLEYLIEGVVVGEGALFIGGREKCFKTGIVVDLILSLATGRPFLDEFRVNRTMKSVVFTAEVGLPTAQDLARRIADSKKVDPLCPSLKAIDIVDTIPTFTINKQTGKPADQDAINGLKQYFHDCRPEVAVFDPLYFAMGGTGVGDMYEIGAVLKNISLVCKEYGVWPVYCHHAKKGTAEDEGRPMELTDLYGAGCGAYARQWILLSHAEPFRNGVANLFMSVGGSAQGDRGLWNVTIDEGVPDDIIGRTWKIATSKDEDGACAELSNAAIEDAIGLLGDGNVDVKDIRFMLNNPSLAALENKLREMVKSGVLDMISGKKFSRREKF